MSFLKKNSYPKHFELKQMFIDVIMKEGIPAVFLWSNMPGRDTHYHRVLKQASEELDDGFVFVTAGMQSELHKKMAQSFGLK